MSSNLSQTIVIDPDAMKAKLIGWLQSEDFLNGLYSKEMKDVDLEQNIKTPEQQRVSFPGDLLFNYPGGIFYELFSFKSSATPEATAQLGNFLTRYGYKFEHNFSWQIGISKVSKLRVRS